jgi:hypothetical protein
MFLVFVTCSFWCLELDDLLWFSHHQGMMIHFEGHGHAAWLECSVLIIASLSISLQVGDTYQTYHLCPKTWWACVEPGLVHTYKYRMSGYIRIPWILVLDNIIGPAFGTCYLDTCQVELQLFFSVALIGQMQVGPNYQI